MDKSFSMFAFLFLGLFLFGFKASADIAPSPGDVLGSNGAAAVVAIIGVGVIALAVWLIIRTIKRKNKKHEENN
jgi:hypothetical protein